MKGLLLAAAVFLLAGTGCVAYYDEPYTYGSYPYYYTTRPYSYPWWPSWYYSPYPWYRGPAYGYGVAPGWPYYYPGFSFGYRSWHYPRGHYYHGGPGRPPRFDGQRGPRPGGPGGPRPGGRR